MMPQHGGPLPGEDGAGSPTGLGAAPGPDVTLGQAAWALMFVVVYIAVAAGVFVAVGVSGLVEYTLEGVVPTLLGIITAASMLALYVHLVRRNALTARDLGFGRPGVRILHLLWQIPVAILTAAVAQGIFLGLLVLAGVDPEAARSTNDPLEDIAALPTASIVIAILVIAVLTPLWEEVLFRGAFLDGFSRRFRPLPAVLLSAALFAAVHLVVVGFAYLFVLGIALALLRRFHRNLWAPILLHAVNNGLAVLLILTAT